MLFMAHSTFKNGENYNELLEKISDKYREIINVLGMKFDLEAEITTLKKNLLSGKSPDYIGSRGEFIMGKILAEYLGWDFVDSAEIIFFNADETLNETKTFSTAHAKLSARKHAIIPGFYGSLPDGKIKTFARGDGDSSDAIVASALKADLFEKWSETTKIYSADPSVISNPEIIKNITYSEAVELNYIGISIVRDSVIFMLRKENIPLKICSLTDNNEMLISSELPKVISRNVAMCIAGRRNFNVIHIEKYGLNKQYGFGEKLFGLFSKYQIPCEHCLSGIHKMSVVVKTPMFDLRRNALIEDIKHVIEADTITVEKNLSLIAVIGQGMGTIKGTFESVFEAMAGAKIKVRMIDQGADDLNIIIGVADKDYEKAVKFLYEYVIQRKEGQS